LLHKALQKSCRSNEARNYNRYKANKFLEYEGLINKISFTKCTKRG
jgi:hypothetical protein